MRRAARRLYRRKRRIRLICGMVLAAAIGVAVLWRAPAFRVEGLMRVSATPEAAPDRLVTTMELHLPAVTWYTIQTGVFSTEEAARDKADDYTDRGAPGTVVSSSGKWRVFIAAYGREEDASAVRQRLGEMQRVETYLYAWECPEVHLRLTGPGAQLDAASAGMTLLQGAAEVMRDTAMLLDASQVNIQDALAELSELDGQLALWTRTARNAFGSQVPEMVKSMLTMAEHCSEKIAALKGVEDPAALSSALKGCGMEQYDRMVSLRTSLLSQ